MKRFPHLEKILDLFRRPRILPAKLVLRRGFLREPFLSSEKREVKVPHISGVRVRQPLSLPKGSLRLLALVTLFLAIYLVFFSPLFLVREIAVRGNHLVSKSKIKEALWPDGFVANRFILLPEKRMRSSLLRSILQIEKVSFSRNLFQARLTAVVIERDTAVVWQTNNERFLVNRAGIIYDYAPLDAPLAVVEDLKNVPIALGQKVVTLSFVEFVTQLFSNLPLRTDLKAVRITVPETTFEIEVEVDRGFRLIFDTTRSLDNQLGNLIKTLQLVGSEKLEYIDLRIEDRIYYK